MNAQALKLTQEISQTKLKIDELTNNVERMKQQLKKLNDVIQHPVYLLILSVTSLNEDVISIITSYLNNRWCSKCCKDYYGELCLTCSINDLTLDYFTSFKSVGRIASHYNVCVSTDENENQYLEYLSNHITVRARYANVLNIYEIGTSMLISKRFKNVSCVDFNGFVISKDICYIAKNFITDLTLRERFLNRQYELKFNERNKYNVEVINSNYANNVGLIDEFTRVRCFHSKIL